MIRIERSQLFHRLVSAIAFGDRTTKDQISQGQIYQLCDLICDAICTESVMVISANMAGFTHAVTGKFGKDEPWPEWCDPNGLQRDFGIEPQLDTQLALHELTVSDRVSNVSTIKVKENMVEDYLQGIRNTWVASNAVAKKLGHIQNYAVYVSDLEQSGEFIVLLVVTFAKTSDLGPTRRATRHLCGIGAQRMKRPLGPQKQPFIPIFVPLQVST